MIVGIVAISKNFAIGKSGKLPWHYSSDLKFFKEITTGNAIVMGSTTWRSIGKALPNRLNIVLSRSGNVETSPEVLKLGSTNEVIALSKYLAGDVFVIGGALTYAEFEGVIKKWIVTFVPVEIDDADIFMPKNFMDEFELEETRSLGDDLIVKILRSS